MTFLRPLFLALTSRLSSRMVPFLSAVGLAPRQWSLSMVTVMRLGAGALSPPQTTRPLIVDQSLSPWASLRWLRASNKAAEEQSRIAGVVRRMAGLLRLGRGARRG